MLFVVQSVVMTDEDDDEDVDDNMRVSEKHSRRLQKRLLSRRIAHPSCINPPIMQYNAVHRKS